jgi:hypothetical protein
MNDDSYLIDDIRRGLTDSELMQKYQISAANLRRKILDFTRDNVVSSADIYWRPILYDTDVSEGERRAIPRYPLKLLLPVKEIGSLESTPAFLIDISEKGGCVQGITAQPGAKVVLEIDPQGMVRANEIRLEIVFRWVESGADTEIMAGFEIVGCGERDLALLRELIRTTLVGV